MMHITFENSTLKIDLISHFDKKKKYNFIWLTDPMKDNLFAIG